MKKQERKFKLYKSSLKRGIALLGAVICLIPSFTSCGKEKKTVLDGNSLEKALIMTLDDNDKIIVTSDTRFLDGFMERADHYKDVISGTTYHIIYASAEEGEKNLEKAKAEGKTAKTVEEYRKAHSCKRDENVIVLFRDEATLSPLASSLTDEELDKISSGKFVDSDLVSIQKRLNQS